MPQKGFEPLTDQLGIPGTSYSLQFGKINEKWASCMLKGRDIIDSYVFKDENVEEDFPNQNAIVGWVLRTVAIPNINPQQVMKITQALVKQAIGKIEHRKVVPPISEIKEIELRQQEKYDITFGNKERILDLLKLESLTSKELAKELNLSDQDTRTYILRLKKENKINVIGKKGRYYVYKSNFFGRKGIEPQITKTKEEKILVFQYNDQLNEFQELEIEEDVPLHELLDSDFILIFVDPKQYRIWIWVGGNNTVRKRSIAIKSAQSIKNRYEAEYKITAIDEGNESHDFKVMVGLEEEIEYFVEQNKLVYEGIAKDLELLESSSREKILLLLEKAGIHKDYERDTLKAKEGLIRLKDEQVKALENSLKLKDEQINILEKILKKKEAKIKSLEKANQI